MSCSSVDHFFPSNFETNKFPKRLRVEGEETGNLQKKVCLAENSPSLQWCGVVMIKDIVHQILQYLSYQDILKFERVAKAHRNYTSARWQELRIQHRLDFDWLYPSEEKHPERTQYLLGKALERYIEERKQIVSDRGVINIAKWEKLYPCFEGFMVRFPTFGAYVWSDLTSILPRIQIESSYQKLFKSHEPHLQAPAQQGGNLLLQGLHKITLMKTQNPNGVFNPIDFIRIYECFTLAIQKKATCASLLALKILPSISKVELPNFYHTLAIQSLSQPDERGPDYRGMEELLKIYPNLIRKFYHSMEVSPPVLMVYGQQLISGSNIPTTRLQEAEEVLMAAIKGYGKHVPSKLWISVYQTKMLLKKFEEAESIADKFLTPPIEIDSLSADDWLRLTFVKVLLGKSSEAESIFDRLLPSNANLDLLCLRNISKTKLMLGQFAESLALLEKIITLDGDNQPLSVWQEAEETRKKNKS